MTDDKIDLSRRKVLGAAATIGAASAVGGLGSLAFFSDDEQFGNNQLTAGELDLRVGWASYYSDWSADEMQYLTEDMQVTDRTGFKDATRQDQFPSAGTREAIATGDLDPCGRPANLPESFVDGSARPVISLDDVKPGDAGEVTFDLHICDNPAYLWLTGHLHENAENGVNEPEADAPGENGGPPGELADAIRTLVYYDEDCDGFYEPASTVDPSCMVFVVDESAVMSESFSGEETTRQQATADALAGAIENVAGVTDPATSLAPHEVGVVGFDEGGARTVTGLIDDVSTVQSALEDLGAAGSAADLAAGLTQARSVLSGQSDECEPLVVLVTGSEPSDANAVQSAASGLDSAVRLLTITLGDGVDSSTYEAIASSPRDAATAHSARSLSQLAASASEVVIGEDCFFLGSLADLLALLETDPGIPLDGDRASCFDCVLDEDGDGTPDATAPGDESTRNCFAGETTQCLGVRWWLPRTRANEVQTDSVTFDLGLYAEQCRHNDGAGQRTDGESAPEEGGE